MVKNRQFTPWATSNAEYGRHLAAQAALKRSSIQVGKATATSSSVKRQSPALSQPSATSGGHSAPIGPHHLPPIEHQNYMLAKEKPDISWAKLTGSTSFPPPKTGLGKRFMREELGRFWKNIQDITMCEGEQIGKSTGNVDLFRVEHEDIDQIKETNQETQNHTPNNNLTPVPTSVTLGNRTPKTTEHQTVPNSTRQHSATSGLQDNYPLTTAQVSDLLGEAPVKTQASDILRIPTQESERARSTMASSSHVITSEK